MKARITLKGIRDKEALRLHTEQRLATALRRLENRITSISVVLEDVTGPRKGGVCQRCRLDVRLKPASEVIIDELGDDPRAALALALARLKTVLSRRVGKIKRGVGAG